MKIKAVDVALEDPKTADKIKNDKSLSQTKIEESEKPKTTVEDSEKLEKTNSTAEDVIEKNRSCTVSIPIKHYEKYLSSISKNGKTKNTSLEIGTIAVF